MVSLPVSRQTNSSTTARSSSSVSPVFRLSRISTIIGTMTFIQPERMRESVPSKSNSTTRALRADTPGETFSTINFILGGGWQAAGAPLRWPALWWRVPQGHAQKVRHDIGFKLCDPGEHPRIVAVMIGGVVSLRILLDHFVA